MKKILTVIAVLTLIIVPGSVYALNSASDGLETKQTGGTFLSESVSSDNSVDNSGSVTQNVDNGTDSTSRCTYCGSDACTDARHQNCSNGSSQMCGSGYNDAQGHGYGYDDGQSHGHGHGHE